MILPCLICLMATHSSTLAWKIPCTEEPGRLRSMGSQRVGHFYLHFHFSRSCIGEGNGNPLQCSCLEHPRDGGAWWAAVLGVAQSQTRLKRLGGGSSSSSSSRHTDEFPHRSAMIRFSVFTSLIMYFWKLISSDLCTFYMTNLLAEFSQLQSARNWN